MLPRIKLAAVAAAAMLLSAGAASPADTTFVTLGTGSGPIPTLERAQPANLLIAGDQMILVDAGDGAAQQVGKAGAPFENIQSVFISHLHFDHTGGLFALLSRRFQVLAPAPVTIYGPPGTKATVDALVQAMLPAVEAAANIRERSRMSPAETVRVVELSDGWTGRIGDITITAASNSHYVLQGESDRRNDTYAFRFDTPGRSIVYTGDTGPSAAVERLATGADILFAEIMEPGGTLARLRASRPDIPPAALAAVARHYHAQHLSPTEVGLMARRAGVKALVLTHIGMEDEEIPAARAAIAAHYSGPVTFASDLDRF